MLGIIACSSDNGSDDRPVTNKDNTNCNEWVGNASAMRLEMPALQKDAKGVYFLEYDAKISDKSSQKCVNFCMEYDSTACHSRWVAFSFDDTTNVINNVSRSNSWHEDANVPQACRLTGDYYTGYQRGHLCASNDRRNSTEANYQTFLMTNMSPQLGSFNSNYWVVLEQLVQRWARYGTFSKLYVCKGGTITSAQRIKTIKHANVRGEQVDVVVPRYYFMAILAETSLQSYQAIGFLLEHKEYGYDGDNYPARSVMKQHAMSIDDLEKITGIDFFCNLNDVAEKLVEQSYSESAWSWN